MDDEIDIGTILYRAEVYYRGGSVFYKMAMVVKLTPKGFWIETPVPKPAPEWAEEVDVVTLMSGIDTYSNRQWFSFWTYQWSTTKEEAVRHLIARKRSHVRHAEGRLVDAKKALRAAMREAGMEVKAEEVVFSLLD